MPALSRLARHVLLAIVAVATLSAVPAARAQDAAARDQGQVWGVQFRLTDLDDEPLPPRNPADAPFAADELAPIIDIDQPETFAPALPAPESPWLDLLDDVPAPAASVVTAALESPAIEATQLVRQSRGPTSISGIRRSPVAIQPVIRGYQQQSIYGQYQGAQFIPVRFDLDSILTSIDPGLIDNLIIIPGPYGVRYGPGLAFIDVQAKPLPRFDVPTLHGRTSVLYQGAGKQFYGHQVLSGGGRDYGYRAVYGHKIGDDYTSGNASLIPSAYNVRDVDLSIARDLADNSTLQFEYLRQDMTDSRFAGLIIDVDFRKTDAMFLRYTNDHGVGGARWLAEAWWNRTVMAGDNQGAFKQRFYRDIRHFKFGWDVFTDADVTCAGCRIAPIWGDADQSKLTGGIDVHYIDQELNEFSEVFGFTGNEPIPRSYMFDLGVFLEAMTAVNCNWRLTIGARMDWVRTHRVAKHVATDPSGTEHTTDFGSAFNAEDLLYHAFVSADREIAPGLDLRVGLGHGERPPSLTERFADFTFLTLVQNPTRAVLGNADLKPEAATQIDLALIGDYDDVRFQVMGFWSLIDEHMTPELAVPWSDTLLRFVNADSTLAGVEFSGEYDWTPSLTPFANLRYVSGRRLDPIDSSLLPPGSDLTEPLPSIYPLESRVGIRWRDPCSNRYGVEFTARIVDNQDRVALSLNESPTGGFATFDLRGYWQARENLRITSGFENLADRNYLEHLNVHEPAVLEPGMNFYFTAQLEY